MSLASTGSISRLNFETDKGAAPRNSPPRMLFTGRS